MHDRIIRNGTLVDGTGSAPRRADVAIRDGKISAVGEIDEPAHEEIDASYEGAEMTVAFNPDYLASGIDAVEGDEVTLATMDPMKPAVLRGVGHEDYLYLLMPVRVP